MAKTNAMNKRILLAIAIIASFTTWAFYKGNLLTISGRITGEKNKPLAGVTISVIGENNQAITDSNGIYFLQNLHPGAKIRAFNDCKD